MFHTVSATRRPFPLTFQARRALVNLAYALAGLLLARFFRRRVALTDLTSARILLVKPCCLGDVIFSTPLARELRRELPAARITYAVGPHSRPALEGNPQLDDLLDLGTLGAGSADLGTLFAIVRTIRAGRYDAAFVLERSAILTLVPALAGIPLRVGIDSGGRGFSLSTAVAVRPSRPESELYLDLLRAVGGVPRSGALEYHPSARARARIDEILNDHNLAHRAFVVIHCAGGTNPGMDLLRKRWPTSHFHQLAERLLESHIPVLLVGANEDRSVARDLLDLILTRSDLVDLVGQLSLDELAELARCATVYVGNDSGPTHLAEAAGARVIGLFGPSDPIVYGPRGRNAVALSSGIWCSPCFEDGVAAPCLNVLCMPGISVERVWQEIQAILLSAEPPR